MFKKNPFLITGRENNFFMIALKQSFYCCLTNNYKLVISGKEIIKITPTTLVYTNSNDH